MNSDYLEEKDKWKIKQILNNYYINQFDEFEKSLNGEKSSDFHKVRKEAISKFAELTFPTQKDEEWKYTNISPLFKHNFSPASIKQMFHQKP